MPFPVLTYSSADAADWMGAPSERWLIHKLRAGAFPGRKVGRNWRMTEQDITDALDVCANDIRRIPTSSHFRVDGQTGCNIAVSTASAFGFERYAAAAPLGSRCGDDRQLNHLTRLLFESPSRARSCGYMVRLRRVRVVLPS